MMTVLLILVGLLASGLILVVVMAATAPVGYEDETGFHFGCELTASPQEPRGEESELLFSRWNHRSKEVVSPLRDDNMARLPT